MPTIVSFSCFFQLSNTALPLFQIYDLTTCQKIMTLSDRKSSNNYLKNVATFNSSDELVLNDGVLWDVRGRQVIHKFDKFNNYVSGVFHPSDLEIIINSEIVSLLRCTICNVTSSFVLLTHFSILKIEGSRTLVFND